MAVIGAEDFPAAPAVFPEAVPEDFPAAQAEDFQAAGQEVFLGVVFPEAAVRGKTG
jgi:hypothetical protein